MNIISHDERRIVTIRDSVCYLYKVKSSGKFIKLLTATSTVSGIKVIDLDKKMNLPTTSERRLISNFREECHNRVQLETIDDLFLFVDEGPSENHNIMYLCIYYLYGCRMKNAMLGKMSDVSKIISKLKKYFSCRMYSKEFNYHKNSTLYQVAEEQ